MKFFASKYLGIVAAMLVVVATITVQPYSVWIFLGHPKAPKSLLK